MLVIDKMILVIIEIMNKVGLQKYWRQAVCSACSGGQMNVT